jgi:hypothetical protein
MRTVLRGLLTGASALALAGTATVAAPAAPAAAGTCNSSWALSIAGLPGGYAGGGPGPTSARTTFWNQHFVSGVSDGATAMANFYDSSAGRPAERSAYGGAPGGTVCLDASMMQGLYYVASAYRVVVNEIAGAAHSTGSYHYLGRAFDIGTVNGTAVASLDTTTLERVSQVCRDTGARAVYNRLNDPSGHSSHIHCEW